MDRVVDALRLEDTRWGYNWKRGVVGDPSLDVIVYNYSAGPDEGNPNVYAVDILGGHCGPSPYASLDQHHRRGRLGRCLDQPRPLVRAQRDTAGCRVADRPAPWHVGTLARCSSQWHAGSL